MTAQSVRPLGYLAGDSIEFGFNHSSCVYYASEKSML